MSSSRTLGGNRVASFSENFVTLACFEVAGRLYAFDVSQLREVVRWQPVTPLPNAPVLIEGVVDLRGSVIPVVDLGTALGLGPVDPGRHARIAVAEIDGLVLGLAVAAAVEVTPVEVERLEDPPALATQTGYEVTRAVVRRPGAEPVLVLSLEQLLESVYRSALSPREGNA
jgi:purine-binding chemotaxis protein CheW